MQKPTAPNAVPPLSVVMPVHNALPYLDEAIDSILSQTFSDFEFVILDDASTDGSLERLRAWAFRDRRIRLVDVPENLGPSASSERVAREARAPVVARMDADDVSRPDRLAEQFELLARHRDVGVVGCLNDIIDPAGRTVRGADLGRLTRRSWAVPFAHGAMMYRRDLFEQVGGYRTGFDYWEDQDLVTRMSGLGRVVVVPRLLYRVRQSATSTRAAARQVCQEDALDRMYRAFDLEHEERTPGTSGGSKVDPRVFQSLGSVTLWSGGRPRLFRRLLQRARIRPDFRSAIAIAWTAWASASPGTLRAFLRLLLSVRNSIARRKIGSSDFVEWLPPSRIAGQMAVSERASTNAQ